MPDILISMNKTTDKLWKYADEWEKTPEHFDGVNPFCLAIHAVRQITNASELLNEQKHGHWVSVPDKSPKTTTINMYSFICSCSECGKAVGPHTGYNYCPGCGARMVNPNES